MTENGVFYYGQDKIDYEVVRKEATYKEKINKPESDKLIAKKAKPRKVVIKVHPDQRVVATAPNDATDEVIHDAMMKRARWIWQATGFCQTTRSCIAQALCQRRNPVLFGSSLRVKSDNQYRNGRCNA